MEAVNRDAAIAQQVERILGKDEVSSSNLDSSSNASGTFGFRRFSFYIPHFLRKAFVFLFLKKIAGAHSFSPIFDEGMRSDYGQKNHKEWTVS